MTPNIVERITTIVAALTTALEELSHLVDELTEIEMVQELADERVDEAR